MEGILLIFWKVSEDLCKAIARVARRISSSYVDPKGLTSFTVCCLITLDKNQGVRPIGVGEVLRRLIGRPFSRSLQQTSAKQWVSSSSVQARSVELKHAGYMQWEKRTTLKWSYFDGWCQQRFNTLNHEATLRNIWILCPCSYGTYPEKYISKRFTPNYWWRSHSFTRSNHPGQPTCDATIRTPLERCPSSVNSKGTPQMFGLQMMPQLEGN